MTLEELNNHLCDLRDEIEIELDPKCLVIVRENVNGFGYNISIRRISYQELNGSIQGILIRGVEFLLNSDSELEIIFCEIKIVDGNSMTYNKQVLYTQDWNGFKRVLHHINTMTFDHYNLYDCSEDDIVSHYNSNYNNMVIEVSIGKLQRRIKRFPI